MLAFLDIGVCIPVGAHSASAFSVFTAAPEIAKKDVAKTINQFVCGAGTSA